MGPNMAINGPEFRTAVYHNTRTDRGRPHATPLGPSVSEARGRRVARDRGLAAVWPTRCRGPEAATTSRESMGLWGGRGAGGEAAVGSRMVLVLHVVRGVREIGP